jgi:hypothetical protein
MLRQWGCDQVQGFYDGRPETGPRGEPIRSRPSPRCLSFRGAGLRPCHLRQPSFTDKSSAPVLLRKPQLPVLGLIGAPQLAAILVLGQRGLEELYSARNTRALLVAGSREVGCRKRSLARLAASFCDSR